MKSTGSIKMKLVTIVDGFLYLQINVSDGIKKNPMIGIF